jgi:hypothetical protein
LQLGKPQVRDVTPGPPVPQTFPPPAQSPNPPVIHVTPLTPHIQLNGSGLIGAGVRLNREPLSIAHADDDRLVVHLPEAPQSGALEVTLPDGNILQYRLEVQPHEQHSRVNLHADRWEPARERM